MVNLSETPATSPDSIASRIAQLNQLAELHLNAGQLDQAQAYCQQALNLDPNCPSTCKTAGNICRVLGQVEVAKRWYHRAIELDPKMAEALANLGTIYAEAKQWQQAVNYYQQAIKVKPDFAGVYRNLAKVWTILNQAASAANCWYRAYELEPTGVTAAQYFEVGNNLLKAGQGTEAIACYKNAIKLNPNWAEAYQNLAAALQRSGALEEATICYRQAIALKAKKTQTTPTPEDTLAAASQGFFQVNGYADPQDTLSGSLSVQGEKNTANNAANDASSIFDVNDYLELAKSYADRRQWQKVISLCQKSLSVAPNNAYAYKLLGNAFQGLGNIQSAMQSYEKAIALKPQFAEALANLGSIYGQQKQFEKAISCYQKAINLKPKVAGFYRNLAKIFAERSGKSDPQMSPQIAECWYRAYELEPAKAKPEEHFNLGNILLKQGQREKAIACYGRAIQLNPNLAAAYHNLGEVLSETGQSQEAITCYRRAIELNPKLIDCCYKLGQELAKQGEWQEALACYRTLISVEPKFAPAYQKTAEILVKQHELDAAAAVYTKVLELQPDNGETCRQLGDIFAKQLKWQDAVKVYGRAIQLNPQNSDAYNYLGYALIQLQRWEESVAVLERAIALKPDFHSCHNFGGALVQLKRWGQALPAYRQALQLNPSSALTHQSLGDVLMKLQRWDEAEKAYSQAVELQPDLAGICSRIADALRERAMSDLAKALGWYHRAIQEQPGDLQNYHKALEIQPDDVQLYVQLANALEKQGNSNGAIVFYQMALQLQPDDAGILQQLEELSKKKGVTANFFRRELTLNSGKNQTEDLRLIAFYLPQYHPIPENDEWWGKGFTEWTNVTKAQPLFEGHYQPHLPADLGFYDLRVPEVREQQAALARQYGIYGFCYYYYWFAGKRLLHRPLDEVLRTKKPDFPFCICWANENWTRRWDGHDNEILMAQDCSNDEQNQAFAEHIVPILLDERYIRVNGAPLLIIYRADLFPNLLRTAEQWRNIFRKNGVGEVHLCIALTFGFNKHPNEVGFDSAVQFPPNNFPVRAIQPTEVGANNFSGKIVDYEDIAIKGVNSQFPGDKVFRTVMTSWDNTARRGNSAYIFLNSTPEIYQVWLRGAIEKTKQVHSGDERLVFINAWNEWAEGAHLEPDRKYGHAYLAATKKALLAQHSWKTSVSIENLVLPYSNQPLVSIIIPVFNQIEYTMRCLVSLAENIQPDTRVEILVINDASTDDTVEKLTKIPGIQLINNPENVGFIHSCNRGAKQAKGKYICFLNNDTEVRPDWLESMVRLIEQDEQVGAVGSKLLYPDGTLQEAGGIIWNDASGWNFGRNSNPEAPEYNYVRPVDYCSGASLLVKKEIFQALGGFGVEFSPAYYEDTDLCFAIRNDLGLKVMYQPKSEVIHYEGVTSGTSTDTGVKRYQKINEPKFRTKWQQALTSHFANNSDYRERASIRLAGKQTILVIDSYVPWYDKEAGGNRLFQILKIFKELGYHVILAPDNFLQSEPYTSELQEMGVEVLYQFASRQGLKPPANGLSPLKWTEDKSEFSVGFNRLSLLARELIPWRLWTEEKELLASLLGNQSTLEEQINSRLSLLDFAWICRPEFNEKYAPLIRQNSKIKIIYDTVDLHYLRLQRAAKILPNSVDKPEADWQKMQALELEMARQADMTVTVTQAEQKLLLEQSIFPVAVVPTIHQPYKGKRKSFRERRDILFIGGYYHSPNVDAVLWLCESIMSKVWQEIPDMVVTLLGSSPPESVQKLASDRVVVPGYIKDVSSYFLSHRVFVAPLRYGAGIKGKIGQSLEYGLPIVSTTIGVEGMNLRHEENVLVADTPEDFANQIIRLYRDENLWNQIAARAEQSIADYSPEAVKISIDRLLKQLSI